MKAAILAGPGLQGMNTRFRSIAFAELWMVGLATGLTIVYKPVVFVTAGVAVFFWLIRLLSCRPFSRSTPADGAVLLLALTLPVTLLATALPEKTVIHVFWLLAGLALYYGIVNWADVPLRFHLWLTGLVLAGLALALTAPACGDWDPTLISHIPAALHSWFTQRALETIHPNILAGLLLFMLPLALAMLLFGGRSFHWLEHAAAGVAVLAMTAILALTLSRGAWLALGAVLVVMPALRWGWVIPAVAALGGGVLAFTLGPGRVLEFFVSSATITTLEVRLEIWSRAIAIVRHFPFTGVGMGTFADVAGVLFPLLLTLPEDAPHVHNLFLQVAVDLGIPGLVAWLGVLALGLRQAWRVYRVGRAGQDALAATLGAGLLCIQIAIVVHGLTDAIPWGTNQCSLMIWIAWGLAMAAGNHYLHRQKLSPA